ncbi:hypothetical protein BF14_022995 [Streptomyces griseus]|uniref:tyrosine-type recombinase/integrase n=1 Tax=Streptomyces globisporus TaxID=1908 RepID=UPI0005C88554|nr:tyrosine-type recombinase/integrase [Streptomyces globisporus]AWL88408.1 mobile element protein [Streptomyces globisporus]PPA42295.1 hypothetical protein BF14_022995 [Streptomyces griseus]RAN19595.1 hypothetical protein A3838_22475 [Streptomyces badius]RAN27511.1 hypothetical protein A3800_22490 [Streptomyces badius]
MDTSYDVRVWQIESRQGQQRASFGVRWSVAGRRRGMTFQTYALADGFRAELLHAVHQGVPFGVVTGLPVRRGVSSSSVNWYDFAVHFVDSRWPQSSGNTRRNTARVLMITTEALLGRLPRGVRGQQVRTALFQWAFNTRCRTSAPDDIAAVLGWIRRQSPVMEVWEDPEVVDDVLRALYHRLDDSVAAASSRMRHRRVLNVAMEYAVRRSILSANPLPKGLNNLPRVTKQVDPRRLLNGVQAAVLLEWVGRRVRMGRCYRAFFATLYYAGLRPEEARALRVGEVVLPERCWGEVRVRAATPEVGSRWSDDGEVRESRCLKGRPEGETRVVPLHPELVEILRDLIEGDSLARGDLLFAGERGGPLAGSVYRRVWGKARAAVLSTSEYHSSAGRRVADLRDTCLTVWLNNGVPPAQVAEWGGTSVAMLFAAYTQCVSGQAQDVLHRVEAAQALPCVETDARQSGVACP